MNCQLDNFVYPVSHVSPFLLSFFLVLFIIPPEDYMERKYLFFCCHLVKLTYVLLEILCKLKIPHAKMFLRKAAKHPNI